MLCDPKFKVICDNPECDKSVLLPASYGGYEGWGLAKDIDVLLHDEGWRETNGGTHLCPEHINDV
jgi:hypothetical protein